MNEPSIIAVGDISFGDHYVCASFGVDSLLRSDAGKDVFKGVKHVLRRGRIVFGNLETVLSEAGLDRSRLHSMHMRGRPQYVDQLVDAGFNVLNIANNHILQHGAEAFRETVDLLQSRGIAVVGVAEPNGVNCKPARLDVDGTEFVFLGYGFEKDKYFSGTTLYAQGKKDAILKDIRRYKRPDNLVVCSFHWGKEFVPYPSRDQIDVGRSAIDAGCDLVLGHHPHVLNGFERHKGKYIFYSLGNFVFDQLWNKPCREGMAVELVWQGTRFDVRAITRIAIGDDYTPTVSPDDCFQQRIRQLSHWIERAVDENGDGHSRDSCRLDRRNRYGSWLYMLCHIYRYNPRVLRQIVIDTIRRRLVRERG